MVEDNPEDARLIREGLVNANSYLYDLKSADCLSEGLNELGKGKVDIVLLDLMLPDSQGLETLHKIHNQSLNVPIIVLADSDEQALAIRAVREGAQDYLVKGYVDSHLLLRVLRYSIEREQLLSTLERQTKELKTSENRLRKIIQENADGIVLVNREGIVLFANPAAETILGRKIEKILGKRFSLPLVVGEKTEADIPLGGNFARTAEIRVVETEWEGEYSFLVSLHDITERKIAEKALQESKELSRSVIETATDAFVEVDSCGLLLEWNRKAEEIFGWPRQEALGRSMIETIFPAKHRKYHLKSLKDFLATGEGPFINKEIELTAIHRDGHEFPIEFKLWPIRAGESYRINAFIRDITELKQLQQLKDEFIRTVSHEMRTPLTTIREGISQVKDGLLGEITGEQKNYFSMVLEDIDRLTRIINDLLDVSQIDSGIVRLNIDEIDLAKLVEGVRSSFQRQAEEKGLEIYSKLPKGRVILNADKDKIIQVFTNLVGNAIKFTKKGHINISVVEDKNDVKCCVSDTGLGISGEELPKIFDKFQRFGRLNGPKEKGTGLGLYIVKAIVELHNGKIRVESRLNKGTRFYISLPKHQVEEVMTEKAVTK